MYKKIWSNLYIFIGVICVFIFLFGFILIEDYLFILYMLAAIFPIYFGIKMIKAPYAIVSVNKIKVFGLFGDLKHEYNSTLKQKFNKKNNRIYLFDGEKVKLNKWFVNVDDWQRALAVID